MPRAPSLPSEARRLQVVTHLLELASEMPPTQIRTAQIAKRMGLSEAALFRHFPSKQDLWLATLEHAITQLWQQVEEAVQPDESPLAGVRSLLFAQLAVNRRIPGLPPLIFNELQNSAPTPCRAVVDDYLDKLRGRLFELLTMAQADHLLSADRSADGLANTLLALVLGLLLQERIRSSIPGQAEAELETALQLLLR